MPPLRRLRLPGLFLAATLLPAIALAWLGWQLIEQDRHLERQRVQDLVESTANRVTATIERELGALERDLGAQEPSGAAVRGDNAVAVRLSRDGSGTTLAGPPLFYQLGVGHAPAEPPGSIWVEAERLEFAERDATAAIQAYRGLARSQDPNVRAGALVRLARAQRHAGRTDEALATYSVLAETSGAAILGDPADLLARWARVDLLAVLDRTDAARAEATSLDADLRGARWHLERTAALTYADLLRPWRTAPEESALANRIRLNDAVAAIWTEWQTRPPMALGNGRRALPASGGETFVVWRVAEGALLVHAESTAHLVRSWQHLWTAPGVAVAVESQDGSAIDGGAPPTGLVSIVKPASDTRLPWTLRVVATSIPADIAATSGSRRRIVLAVVIVLAILIVGTGYLVAGAVNKELALARQQSAFVSAVSHEFRSPLTSLAHLTSLLRSDFQPTDERRRQYYDMLANETDRLRHFVETLLDFGRIQAGATRYHLAPVDPAALVSGIVEEFERHQASGGHQVSFAASAGVPRVSADAEAVGRAVWNLLENAAKYSPDESSIVVRVEEDDGRVAIRVSDQGGGIPDAEQPLIFDQFYRGAAASASAVKGTGVGLAVVRHIVLAHHGDIRCESKVSAGSTFSILLPAAVHERATSPKRKVS